MWRAVTGQLPGETSQGRAVEAPAHSGVLHVSLTCPRVAIPAFQTSPGFIQEDFPNPNNILLKVRPVQIFIPQIINSPFPSFTKR